MRNDGMWRGRGAIMALVSVMAIGCAVAQTQTKAAAPNAATSDPVLQRRFANLRHGINTGEWFAQSRDYSVERLRTNTTLDDFKLIKAMGFDHIRLSIDPQPMWHRGRADAINGAFLAELDSVIHQMLEQGLAVIIDIHPESDFKAKLASNDTFVEEFADLWRALAKHYSALDQDRVFYEVMNEPEMRDRYRWMGVQAKLAAAIRQGDAQHTIIVAGANWSADQELLFLEPLADPNVIYNFHFYEPHIFTHQGATWGVNYWHHERGLPYPPNAEAVSAAAATIPDAANRIDVIRYGQDGWGPARIEAEIAQVARWAEQHHALVTCNEFGVYRDYNRPEDRARWITDVREALERHGMGWTMWDYSGGFGVVTKQNKRVVPDIQVLKALGLRQ